MINCLSLLRRQPVRLFFIHTAIVLVSLGLSACARLLPVDAPMDAAAEQLVAHLKITNTDLQRFKCVGKMVLAGPDQPSRSLRAAVAGQLDDQLRIDMFAPFGGAAGTFASDGRNLFLVMHPSREYYKKRFGSGSLHRLIQIDVTVGDLLELMVGRIPMDNDRSSRLVSDPAGFSDRLELVDRSGRVRQRIILDESMRPQRSEWFDHRRRRTHTLTIEGHQMTKGFRLPQLIELTGPNGARVTVALENYEPNAELQERLFTPENPWS